VLRGLLLVNEFASTAELWVGINKIEARRRVRSKRLFFIFIFHIVYSIIFFVIFNHLGYIAIGPAGKTLITIGPAGKTLITIGPAGKTPITIGPAGKTLITIGPAGKTLITIGPAGKTLITIGPAGKTLITIGPAGKTPVRWAVVNDSPRPEAGGLRPTVVNCFYGY
jgi:hypothetical protein